MNRWIAALKKRETGPETECQKCQNPSRGTFGTFGTASSERNTIFSGDPDIGAARYVAWTEEARRDLYEERAAIMEFDGGMTREEADATAWQEVIL